MNVAEIDDHPIRETLKQIHAARSWNEVLSTTPATNTSWLLERVFHFAAFVEQRLEGTPKNLISVTGLTSINNALQTVLAGLHAFRAAPSDAALNEANQGVDTAMQSLWAVPVVTGSGEISIARASEAFFEQGQRSLQRTSSEADELSRHIDGLRVTIAELGALAGQIGETLGQQKTESGAINAELKRDFTKTDQEYREKFGGLIDEQKTMHASVIADMKGTANDALRDLEAKRAEAAQIVQIVGNIGVTGNYQRIAETEGKKADRWRMVSFVVLVAATVFGAYTLLEFSKDEVKWITAVVRMLFAFVIASISLYTARESARHRSNADSARRRELELASLGPFIESLPKESQEEIRKKLTELYFGGDVTPHVVDAVMPVKAVEGVIDKIVDGVVNVAKAKIK